MTISRKIKDFVLRTRTLSRVSRWRLSRSGKPVICVVGSHGKTTTKDLLEHILSLRHAVLATNGSANDLAGMNSTLLRLDRRHEIILLELGIDVPGEMRTLGGIARPDVVVFTGVGEAHAGKLGGRSGALREKLRILEPLKPDGTLAINSDDDLLRPVETRHRRVCFGLEGAPEVTADTVRMRGLGGSEFELVVRGEKRTVALKLVGRHTILNALGAAAGALGLAGIDEMKQGLEAVEPRGLRLEPLNVNGLDLLVDCYNASPAPMVEAIRIAGEIAGRNAVLALGSMLELGEFSQDAHRRVGVEAAKANPAGIVLLGDEAATIGAAAVAHGFDPGRVFVCRSLGDFAERILQEYPAGGLILLKGSRGLALEAVLPVFQARVPPRRMGQLRFPLEEPSIVKPEGAYLMARVMHRLHHGVDFPAREGQAVRACADGRLTQGFDETNGNWVRITHANGLETRYCHLSSFSGTEGAVEQGAVIGFAGRTGNVPGNRGAYDYTHLHFEVRLKGVPQNPFEWL